MNRLRVVTLTLLVLVTTAGMLPITESLAKWSRRSAVSQHKRYRKHSRAWWRRHRALVRVRRARAAERRRLAEQARADGSPNINTSLLTFNANVSAPVLPAGLSHTAAPPTVSNVGAPPAPASTPARSLAPARSSLLPFDFATPHNWTAGRKTRSGAAVFTVATSDGRAAGTAVVAPVSLSSAELAGVAVGPRSKTLG